MEKNSDEKNCKNSKCLAFLEPFLVWAHKIQRLRDPLGRALVDQDDTKPHRT